MLARALRSTGLTCHRAARSTTLLALLCQLVAPPAAAASDACESAPLQGAPPTGQEWRILVEHDIQSVRLQRAIADAAEQRQSSWETWRAPRWEREALIVHRSDDEHDPTAIPWNDIARLEKRAGHQSPGTGTTIGLISTAIPHWEPVYCARPGADSGSDLTQADSSRPPAPVVGAGVAQRDAVDPAPPPVSCPDDARLSSQPDAETFAATTESTVPGLRWRYRMPLRNRWYRSDWNRADRGPQVLHWSADSLRVQSLDDPSRSTQFAWRDVERIDVEHPRLHGLRGVVTGLVIGSTVLALGSRSDRPNAATLIVAAGAGVLTGYGASRTTDWRTLYCAEDSNGGTATESR